MHERSLAKKLQGVEARFQGMRAFVGEAARLTAPSCKRYDALGKSVVKKAACGCRWTHGVAAEKGYDVDPTCALCGLAVDTPKHRAYECTHPLVVAAREAAASPELTAEFLAEAVASPDDHPLFSRLTIPHPADS